MPLLVSLLFAKLSAWMISTFTSGSASTWPGHLALKLDSNFVERVLRDSRTKVVLVCGTNGKTTSSSMISHILNKNGKSVVRNAEGANLLNGIASTLVKRASIKGKLGSDFAIFEVDENNLPIVLSHVHPNAIVALNLFRDQLDRYGEVNTIASKWRESFEKMHKTTLVLNADDPQVRWLGYRSKHDVKYFGVEDKYYSSKQLGHDVDSVFCPVSGDELKFSKVTYSHLGKYKCLKCKFFRPKADEYVVKKYPLEGVYNMYNTRAALECASLVLGADVAKLKDEVSDFSPSFGRGESIEYQDRKFLMLLSKNPAGFNQSIQRFIDDKASSMIILALNDRVPDGRDVSWIWDVEFEELAKKDATVLLTGDRVWDLAIRLKHAGVRVKSFEKYEGALLSAAKKTKHTDLVYVLPTYSAMLDIRGTLAGRRLL